MSPTPTTSSADDRPGFASPTLNRCAAWCDAHRALVILAVGLLSFLGCMAVNAAQGRRPPRCHDELSYLFAADTFAQGRLTNPPHPLWQHFQTFHIMQQPTCMSKFPPMQGLVLALGQVLTGDVYIGIFIGVALLGMALCWMLYAWVPPLWAVAGSLMAVSTYAITGYWGSEFWGGAVAATGGALAYGAARRLVVRPRIMDGAWLGVGAIVLALSRPFEGALVLVPIGLLLLATLIRSGAPARRSLIVAGIAAAAIVLPGLAFQAYYNYRVTGHAAEMPYTAYSRQYESSAIFIWQPNPPMKTYTDDVVGTFWASYRQAVDDERAAGMVRHVAHFAHKFYAFYVKRPLFVPGALFLAAIVLGRRDKWMLFALGSFLWSVAGHCLCVYYMVHYSAPNLGLFVILCTFGFWKATSLAADAAFIRARARLVSEARAVRFVTAAAAIALFALIGIEAKVLFEPQLAFPIGSLGRRDEVKQRILQSSAGPALVFLRYLPGHPRDSAEWAYNRADVDASDVVWVHDLGTQRNAELIDYYEKRSPRRAVWLLELADEATAPALKRYAVP